MTNHNARLLQGTLLFSGVFLGICFLIVHFFPATEEAANSDAVSTIEKKDVSSTFNSYTTLQDTILTEELLEEAGINSSLKNDNEFILPLEDKALALYRNPKSRPTVEWFYSRVTASREIAQAILEFADKNEISPSLAFAVAYVESRYKPRATNVNQNNTIDRGLFQLNSATFPKLTEEEFYNPRVSARYGMLHLRYCIDIAGNEITGLAVYNAGAARVKSNTTPQKTLNYVAKVSSYRSALDSQFSTEVLAFYGRTAENKDLAMLN